MIALRALSDRLGTTKALPVPRLQASANSITGPVRIDDNSGALEGPARAQAAPAFRANRVTGPLRCEGNLPALVHTGTAVLGPRSGQCREER
ncbi:hypothetical protein [Streptomyces yangpuensis]|uniref:hypothetical protein n=1 Tax=Streptomyces yangpuensis TaxID=1648182 RepID=UPI00371AD5ED